MSQISSARVIVGVLAGLFIMVAAFLIISPTGTLLWSIIDEYIPAVPGVGLNTNTNFWGNMLLYPLAFSVAILSSAMIIDQHMTRRTEAVVVFIVFIALMFVSGFNYWSRDSLINVSAQAAIDIVLYVFSLALVATMLRWSPTIMLTMAIQRIGLFLVTVFGFVLPLFYATKLITIKFGYSASELGVDNVSDWMKFFAVIAGFAATLLPSVVKTREVNSD